MERDRRNHIGVWLVSGLTLLLGLLAGSAAAMFVLILVDPLDAYPGVSGLQAPISLFAFASVTILGVRWFFRANERFSGLDDWWRPFQWITLTPIVTVPISYILFELLAGVHEPQEIGLPPNEPIDLFWGGGPGECDGFLSTPCYEYFEVVPTVAAFTVPGLINLVPFVWIASSSVKARFAGIVAGLLGLLRLSLPAMVLMLSFDTVTGPDGAPYFKSQIPWLSFGPTPYIEAWGYGVLAWVGCLATWAVFGGVISRLSRASGRGVACRIAWTVLGVIGGACLFVGGVGLVLAVAFLVWLRGFVWYAPAASAALVLVPLAIATVGAGALWFLHRRGHEEETGHVA